ncbi:MAG: antitoxin [Campylobacterota bacterium]
MSAVAKVFKNGQSQAIRIPKEFRVDTQEVYIEKVGNSLVIKPKSASKWDQFFDHLEKVDTKDFLQERYQPKQQNRELF